MLGERLTTAAPVQLMKFDEASFDLPGHPRRRKATWLLAIGASIIAAIATIILTRMPAWLAAATAIDGVQSHHS